MRALCLGAAVLALNLCAAYASPLLIEERRLENEILKAADEAALRKPDCEKVCHGCKAYFGIVKKVIGDANKINKDQLEKSLKLVCKILPHKIPGVDELCKKLGPEIIDKLYDYIKNVEKGIEPEKICQILKLCPVKPTPTLPPAPTLPTLPTLPPVPTLPTLPPVPTLPSTPITLPPIPTLPSTPITLPTLPPVPPTLPTIPTLPPVPSTNPTIGPTVTAVPPHPTTVAPSTAPSTKKTIFPTIPTLFPRKTTTPHA